MSRVVISLLAILVTACAAQPETGKTYCKEPRPQVCTLQYEPTCGTLVDGSVRDYSSPCNACADDQVVAVVAGACVSNVTD